MNKRIKLSAITGFIFTTAFLLMPQQVHGFVFDLAKNQLAALSGKTGPVAAVFFSAFLFFALGYMALYLAASLLQGIIAVTPVLLSVTTGAASDFVRIGWSFTAGIVNLVMIVAFIIIAFAVILGLEKIQLKKALPRLIIVALFVNFTLLFVGMGIDASNFLFNTVANQFLAGTAGGENIFFHSLTPLINLGQERILIAALYFITTAMGLLIPYVNVAIQVGWIAGIPLLLPSVAEFLVFGAIMWGLASLFLLYFFVFLIRIFIIQVLAVLAPLAFFCLIFDETKKYWDQWLSHLVQWLFVGVIFIFLMYFGLAMAPIVITMATPFAHLFFPGAEPAYLGWFANQAMNILGYIILLAYFTVIFFIAKKFIPAAAGAVISQVKGVVKSMAPFAGAIGEGTGKFIRNREAKRENEIKEREGAGLGGNLGTRIMKAKSWAIRRAHNLAGTSVEQERKKDVESKAKAMEKRHGNDYGDAVSAFKGGIRSDTDKMALLQYLSGGGAGALTKLNNEAIGGLIELAGKRGDSKTVRSAMKHMSDRGDVGFYEEKLKELESTAKEEITERNSAISPDKLKLEISRRKEVMVAKNNLDAAIKIQSAMISDIKKADPEVKNLENQLEEEQKNLATATSNNNTVGAVNAKKEIEKFETKIKGAKAKAIHKIAAQSLKLSEIENLSAETLKNDGFLKAIVENRGMSVMKAIEERTDGSEAIGRMSEIIKGITAKDDEGTKGTAALKTLNRTLYNDIRVSVAGQALFSDTHDEIKRVENQVSNSAAVQKATQKVEELKRELSEKTQEMLASKFTGKEHERLSERVKEIEKKIRESK